MSVPAYDPQSPGWNESEYDRQRRQQQEQEALSQYNQQQGIGFQVLRQAYENAAQQIQNRNALSNASGNYAATQMGALSDTLRNQNQAMQSHNDLLSQQLADHRYGYGLRSNLAQQLSRNASTPTQSLSQQASGLFGMGYR